MRFLFTSEPPEPSPIDAWLLSQQLSVPAANMRTSAIGNLINAAILVCVFYNDLPVMTLLAGGAITLILISQRIMSVRHIPDASVQPADLVPKALFKTLRAVELNAALLGFWWGLVVGSLLTLASPHQQMFLGILGSGMMGSGVITYRSLKRAAQLYISFCSVCVIIGLLLLGTAPAYAACGLTCCYLVVLFSNIRTNSDNIRNYALHQREAQDAADTIKLLLNDFTEQGSDWMFELDVHGNLLMPSQRFAEAAQRPASSLDGLPFLELFDSAPSTALLATQFQCQRAFRHHTVSLSVNGEVRWWSVSARPTYTAASAFRGIITDITAQRNAEEKVSYMAHYDSLTNLPNRFMFNEALLRAYNWGDGAVALMYLDLDHFKSINDTLGHPVGDQLLQAAARRLEKCLDPTQLIARLGGDEFGILLPFVSVADVEAKANFLVTAMAEPFALEGHDVVIGTSIGIACAPRHGDTAETLLKNADLALYIAKTRGRNRYAHFEAGMDEAAQARRLLEMDLRSSLGKDEMRLHYQPLVNIEDGTIIGYEALIRWEHPVRGFVMPGEFIPIAEETGMIVQIGEWVIRQALDDLAGWADPITVSINLSPAQMRSPTLISTLINSLARTGVDARRVCLEITETVLMHDSESNINTLHKLSSLGVAIALDDFGTGYSSLNYLRSFPFSKIKIDKCFIEDIDTREDCQAIVRSVVSLAKSLGMTTTAEGVERPAQRDQLILQGCSEVQGFLYSKAVPIDQLTDLRTPRRTSGGAVTRLNSQLARESRTFASAAVASDADSVPLVSAGS